MLDNIQWAEAKRDLRLHGVESYFGDIRKGRRVGKKRLMERLDGETWFQALYVCKMWLVTFITLTVYFSIFYTQWWHLLISAALIAAFAYIYKRCDDTMYKGQPLHSRERLFIDPTTQEISYYYNLFNYKVGYYISCDQIEDAIYDESLKTMSLTGQFMKTITSPDEEGNPRTKMFETETVVLPNVFPVKLNELLKDLCPNYTKFQCGMEHEAAGYCEIREGEYNSRIQSVTGE